MKRLWILLIGIMIISFSVLGWVGTEIFRQAPPIPRQVVRATARYLYPLKIFDGQNVWQAMGGMQIGSIWGHGSYVAPDWTADYLHREALFILNDGRRRNSARTTIRLVSEQKPQCASACRT